MQPLLRILGLGFGLAMAFGNTIGVGILRLPGTLAAALGDSRWIVLFWVLGGAYSLLGAVAVAELAAMMPRAGGFYVYARRAFGSRVGFAVGWCDWFNNVATIAYASITAATFLGALWPVAAAHAHAIAFTILTIFTCLHWGGLHLGRALTGCISVTVGLMLLALVAACFTASPVSSSQPPAGSAVSLPLMSVATLAAVVAALRSVLVAYDGWYAPIYFAEESTHPDRTLPRAMIGGTMLIVVMYIIVNLSFLRVLPLSVLAASQLPAADAARVVLPQGGATFVTLICFATTLSLTNASLLLTPRILLVLGRDGLFFRRAAQASLGGTPRFALGVTSVAAGLLILTGTFEQIVALAAVLFLLDYISAYAAVFVLRRRQPAASRPFRAFGFPTTTAVVLIGSILFLIGAVISDPRSGLIVGLLLLVCIPIHLLLRRRQRVNENASN